MIHTDDREAAAQSFARVLETGSVEAREYRIMRGDGELRWISDRCFTARDTADGSLCIIVGLAEDITEDRRLREELHRLATTDMLTRTSNRGHFFECAERLQREIRANRFRQAGAEFAVSISQGLTIMRTDDSSIDDLYARADMAMYKAKLQGKNRIVTDVGGT